MSSLVLLKGTIYQNHLLTRVLWGCAQGYAVVTSFPGMLGKDSDPFHPMEVGTETGKRVTDTH